jgi:hypothetical protein
MAPKRLVRGVPRQQLGGAIEKGHVPVRVDANHAVGNRPERDLGELFLDIKLRFGALPPLGVPHGPDAGADGNEKSEAGAEQQHPFAQRNIACGGRLAVSEQLDLTGLEDIDRRLEILVAGPIVIFFQHRDGGIETLRPPQSDEVRRELQVLCRQSGKRRHAPALLGIIAG